MLSHQPKSTLEPAQPSSLFDMTNLVWGSILDLSWDTIAGKSAHIVVLAYSPIYSGGLATQLTWPFGGQQDMDF